MSEALLTGGDGTAACAQPDTRIELIGASAAIRHVRAWLAKVAPTDSTVLLCGETGTGKELVARALHYAGARAGKPFVAINCASLTETLLESELFGHERGAFTGAVALKRGKLELADGGTVLLDEIGELPMALQPRLLRVLETREFERVGGTRPLRLNIRLVAATNIDIEDAARQQRFRRDLYYRLDVVSLTLPPLRDRREDIPLLADHFAARFGESLRGHAVPISPAALDCLVAYDWPGNVRELENAIQHAIVLGTAAAIQPSELPAAVIDCGIPIEDASRHGFHEAVRQTKRRLLLAALSATGGNCTEAARRLGLHPTYLHRLVTRLKLRDHLNR